MEKAKILHERDFAGKPVKSFRVYEDPFGEDEICVELAFLDGQIEFVCIGPGKPGMVSSGICYELPSPNSSNLFEKGTTR